jgi:CRISPR system Cascade subunit CasE
MYLSRLILNPRNKDVRRDLGNLDQLHKTISHGFPEMPPDTSFFNHYGILFRIDIHSRTGIPSLLVQSNVKPDWQYLEEMPNYLDSPPECKSIEKNYDLLSNGQALAFRLRANVTKKIDTKSGPDGERRNGRRIPLRTPEEQIQWLKRKGAEAGFVLMEVSIADEVKDIRIMSERDVEFEKKKTGQKVTYGSVLFEGKLRITDADAFRKTLMNGVGPAKSYGFGLFSIAPVC